MKIVISTAPPEAAEMLASTLVEERLAACVSILSGVLSIYRWEGTTERGVESLLVAKTSDDGTARLMARLAEIHPNSVPEVVAIDAAAVHSAYLEWVTRETSAQHA